MSEIEPGAGTVALSELRGSIVEKLYRILVIAGLPLVAAASVDPIGDRNWLLLAIYLTIYGCFGLAFVVKLVPTGVRSGILVVALLSAGVSELSFFGYGSAAFLFFHIAITFTCWLVGVKSAWWMLGGVLTAIFVVASVYVLGDLDMSSPQRQIADEWINWVSPVVTFTVTTGGALGYITVLLRELTSRLTESVAREQKMAGLVKHQEMLIQEIHHRVRNNLQLIISLIKLDHRMDSATQSAETSETLSRINAISIVHDEFHRAGAPGAVSAGSIASSVANLFCRGANAAHVSVTAAHGWVTMGRAVAFALLVHELLLPSAHLLQNGSVRHLFIDADGSDDSIAMTLKLDGAVRWETPDAHRSEIVDALMHQINASFDLAEQRLHIAVASNGSSL